MRHLDDNTIRRYVLGEVLEPDLISVDGHLADCPECVGRVRALRYVREHFDVLWDSWTAAEHGRVARQWRLAEAVGEMTREHPSLAERARKWLAGFREEMGLGVKLLMDRHQQIVSLARAAMPLEYQFQLSPVYRGVAGPEEMATLEKHLNRGSELLAEDRPEEAAQAILQAVELGPLSLQSAVSEVHRKERRILQTTADSALGRVSVKYWTPPDEEDPIMAVLLPKHADTKAVAAAFDRVRGEAYLLAEFRGVTDGVYTLHVGLASPPGDTSLYQKGDSVGVSYQVCGLLGQGGFGHVYLADFRHTGRQCALKTFRTANRQTGDLFRREVSLWVGLERHPCIVPAILAEQIHGRLFVAMHYVAPDTEGRTSLRDYLVGSPLQIERTLEWAVQLCRGMEHANAHGIKAHLDIKPDNILIGCDGRAKITDFGLATVLDKCASLVAPHVGGSPGDFSLGLIQKEGRRIYGTPGYIAPEVFGQGMRAADVRSDIYSLGLVMWQMATGRREPPFHVPGLTDAAEYAQQVFKLQTSEPIPHIDSPLWPVIRRSLEVEPARRYPDFAALREDLETLYVQVTGSRPDVPAESERTGDYWNNLGISLESLGRYDEALAAYDRALELDPESAHSWSNKGALLRRLRRYDEAMACQDKALALDPRFAYAWHGRGKVLMALKRHEEAIAAFDKALEVHPTFSAALGAKAHALELLGRCEDALGCYRAVAEMDRLDAEALAGMGRCLHELGDLEKAIDCYDRTLEIEPQDVNTMYNRALAVDQAGRRHDAVEGYRAFLAAAESARKRQIEFANERLAELEGPADT